MQWGGGFVIWPTMLIFGVAGLAFLGMGIGLILNKVGRERRLAELRAAYNEAAPTDPELGRARALHTSMMTDAARSDSTSHHAKGGTHGESGSGGGDGSD